MKLYSSVGFIIIFFLINASAYETQTHSKLTATAIEKSSLDKDSNLFEELGLDITTSDNYFPSIVPSDPEGLDPNQVFFIKNTSITRIIRGGAVLEDADVRSRHHFYDPQNGGAGGGFGHRSPDWILETVIHPQGSDSVDVSLPGQEFSYNDAQKYFYNALISPPENVRRSNFGLMFRSLGHVVHHIQDMAQPQHVRDDAHCDAAADFPGPALICYFFRKHNPSYFEKYTNMEINFLTLSSNSEDYPIFPTARDFWDNSFGSGIAETTSRNFVSDGTNYRGDTNGNFISHPLFPVPAPLQMVVPVTLNDLLNEDLSLSEGEKQTILQRLGCISAPDNECIVDFIQSWVMTAGGESIINNRSSSISIFDEEIQTRNIEISFNLLVPYKTNRLLSLNRFNFEQAYPFLLSRAVSYSAGLIDHFFRGRLEVEKIGWSETTRFMIAVKNVSTDASTLGAGIFEIYYESSNGERKRIPYVEIIDSGLPLMAGNSVTLLADFPEDLNEELEKPFVLVFNALEGQIGEEKGIATTRFSPPITGKVEKVSRLGGKCVGKIYEVRFYFDEQPHNNGRVNLEGEISNRGISFGGFPEGVEVISDGSRWFHGTDPATGSYLYFVSNRLILEDHDPCKSHSLGEWRLGETVRGVSPGFFDF